MPTGGHVSGVFWGEGPPELVFLHDIGDSARRWDAVALAAGRPAVAIDLPGRAAAVICGDQAGALTAADLARLRARAPGAGVVTVPGAGADITARPAALVRLIAQPPSVGQ